MLFLRTYVAALVAFLAADIVWLMLVGGPMFESRLGDWLRPKPHLAAAAVFYPVFDLGLVVLAIDPSGPPRSLAATAGRGALLGLTAYATFDLTNLAILQRYTVDLALADMLWGTLASTMAAAVGWRVAGAGRQ